MKWFNSAMGYGLIQPEDGGKSIFVSIVDVERAGVPDLSAQQAVIYDAVRRGGKFVAEHLRIEG